MSEDNDLKAAYLSGYEAAKSEYDDLKAAYLSGYESAKSEYDARIKRLHDVLLLGVEARNAQRAYFKSRTQSNLVASKVAEKAFDDAARAALEEGKE